MKTSQIEDVDREFFRDPSAWRHHGLGMLQREISGNYRVHVWHPGLRWLNGPRAVHDHRFDLRSILLMGEIFDERWDVVVPPDHESSQANVDIWQIVHAKAQTGNDAHKIGPAMAQRNSVQSYLRGDQYVVPRRHFHTTKADDLAVTVVERFNFDHDPARVLSEPGAPASSAISGAHGRGEFNKLNKPTIERVLAMVPERVVAAIPELQQHINSRRT